MTQKPLTYADAGVSIAAGNALVKAIAPLAKSTARPGANAELGGFGGFSGQNVHFDFGDLGLGDIFGSFFGGGQPRGGRAKPDVAA